jgi:hypothetical protein
MLRLVSTHVLLLLMHVANLKVNIFLAQWSRRVVQDVFEAL